MPKLGYPPVLIDIIEEHFEELDFLWELREGVIFAPDWNLAELAELEERAEAHLDGLRLAEAHAIDIARPALTGEETFAATAATFVFTEGARFEGPDSTLPEELLMAIAHAEAPTTIDGLRIGLRHSFLGSIRETLPALIDSQSLLVGVAVADVLAFQRIPFEAKEEWLAEEDPAVLKLVYGVLGRQGKVDSWTLVERALQHEDVEVRRAALRAAAASGLTGLAQLCKRTAKGGQNECLEMLGVLGLQMETPFLVEAARKAETAEAAIAALGALGNVESVPVLLELMGDEALVDLAAAAFKRITGAEDIEGERPPEEPIGDGEVDAEFEVRDELPVDVEKARGWWERNQGRFEAGGRWQAGREVSMIWGTPGADELPLGVRRDLFMSELAVGGRRSGAIELEVRSRRQSRSA